MNGSMKTRWILIWLLAPLACSDASTVPETYTLCDCVIHPPNSDAKLAACSDIIDAMPPSDLATQALECKRQIPVPDGGPDACYCLTADSQDPAVFAACEAVLESVNPAELSGLMRRCAAARVQSQ